MAALIGSGYRFYRYVMYEITGKKVKVCTVPRKKTDEKYGVKGKPVLLQARNGLEAG
jgi:hypothetical protein